MRLGRLNREDELHLQLERLLRMRWLLVWKYAERVVTERRKLCLVIFCCISTQNSRGCRQRLRRLGTCLDIGCSTHVLHTVVMFPQLSCKRQDQKSTNNYQSKFQQRFWPRVSRRRRRSSPSRALDEIFFTDSLWCLERGGWTSRRNPQNWVGRPCRQINVCSADMLTMGQCKGSSAPMSTIS